MNAPSSIGETLLAARLISADQLRIALHEQQQRRQPLGRLLVELGFVSESALRDTLAADGAHPCVDLADTLAAPAASVSVCIGISMARPGSIGTARKITRPYPMTTEGSGWRSPTCSSRIRRT